ncbi:folylpolyglutamate synthase [Apilactobacillus ozensis DSM 23829 = JCM 17196]|uniref:Dihydrofolate synthase/folylpolyglutamate synthase n=1 Tax=Apilactobacillus ozensis DSM 23829 = JCM 17196 TaxID=1423781 RepID=A0A0R2ANI6_9LACO|nr:folylpolyglutamate synthase/dihydrofolate synthase family protein [Apilactobacillus ozensis]KRM68689.1 folylpolyglutamate synthase [Apilactobacillus ozensis DSM 23829 = JCM 17196]
MNYNDAINYIHGRKQFKKHPNLDTIKLLLSKLDNPQNKINAIHVAGTNGKGSTVAFLRNLFQADGYSVGTFTSPFIIKFNERISVNGVPITNDELVQLVEEIKSIVDIMDTELGLNAPTEFEIITAMMFKYFADNPVDVVIVEVGIGGILDSTNVFTPKVSVITTIGYDHMKILGNTLSEIAAQKAGIIKPRVPVVVGNLPDDALNVIKKTAQQKNSSIDVFAESFTTHKKTSLGWLEKFDFSNDDIKIKDISIKMLGVYQVHNAACALQAYLIYQNEFKNSISISNIKTGLLKTSWAGRFEELNSSPLVVIDGAHNEPAVKELAKLIDNHFYDKEVYIILAVLADKQYIKMINTLLKVKNIHLVLTEFDGVGTRKAADFKKLITEIDNDSVTFINNWKEAIAEVSTEMSDDDVLIITGSLYFISDVRKLFK